MKTLLTCSHRWFTLGVIVAGLGVFAPSSLQAGESILFSREKPRTAPEKGTLAPRAGQDGRSRLAPLTPFDLDIPSQPQNRSRETQKDRKQKAAELEKKNWMVFTPGELQEQEEENEALGIRDASLDKDDDTAGGLFFRKDDDKNRPRSLSQPGRPVPPGSKAPSDEPARMPEDNTAKSNNPENREGKAADTSLNALMPKANDLRLNLGAAKSGADAAESSPLRSLVAGPANDRPLATGSRQQGDADGLLFTRPSSTFKPAGPDNFGPAFSWRNDASARPATPGFTPSASRPASDFSGTLNNPASRNLGGSSVVPSGTDPNLGRSLGPNNINAPNLNGPVYLRPSVGGLGTPQQQQPSPLQRTTRDTFSMPSR